MKKLERMVKLSNVLREIEPQLVFKYFEELSQIPRCSGNEKGVSDYLVNFAKEKKLEVIQDEALNVIIKKAGTKGYENSPIVILQGHMDMVCEKNKGTHHDFTCDPIQLRIEDDMIYGTGTTLGADNGVAVAYCLALLASNDIPHPPLEVIVTTEEETGMGGASQLNPNNIKGKILINIDAEEEGVFFASCAGGLRNRVYIPLAREAINRELLSYTIKVRGLKGGHSGMDISKERGNANKITGRVLNSLAKNINFKLVEINGGSKMNAIPREADVKILIETQHKEKLEESIKHLDKILKNELKASDSDVSVQLEYLNEDPAKAFTDGTKNKVISALMLIPNGVQSMSMDIKDLVQSSTNIGVVTTTEEHVILESAIRSSVRTLKHEICDRIHAMASALGFKSENGSEYPEWEYNPDSYIRKVFEKTYFEVSGKKAEITAIHAGLECGLFGERLGGDIDMISFGPNMYDVHTPNEHLSISSTERTWEFLCGVLKGIK